MPRPNDPMTLDLSGADCIAYASSEADGRERWTVLSVFRLADLHVAQIEAMSTVEGERTKTRRVARVNLEHALKFFDDSDLGRSVCATAREWDENRRRRLALVGDKEWTDREALIRLYGEEPTGRKGYSGLLAADFGVGESTARAAIANGTAIKVPLARVLPFLDLSRLEAARENRRG
jgi:hypothetical protein